MFGRGSSKKERKSGNCYYPNDVTFVNLLKDKKSYHIVRVTITLFYFLISMVFMKIVGGCLVKTSFVDKKKNILF